LKKFEEVFKYTKYLSVLFVEDDRALREEIGGILEDFFAEVSYGVDGNDGLRQYKNYAKKNNRNFNLVITDIEMPHKNGLELIKEIRGLFPNQHFVVLSAYKDSEYLLDCINLGVSQYLIKPIELDDFLKVIGKISKKLQNYQTFSRINPYHLTLGKGLIWDKKEDRLTFNGKMLVLTHHECLTVKYLIQNIGYVCSVNNLVEMLKTNGTDANSDSIRNMMSRLRRKLPLDIITNVYSKGYKLEAV
jgi:DNA-binding response OmpR family regulator